MSWIAIVVALSALVSAILAERRRQPGSRWRKVVILVLSVALLILILQPATKREVDLETATVLTPGATRSLAAERGVVPDLSASSVALPGVTPWSSSTERAPDLATFLRRNPQIDHLQILGAGLEPWDLEGLPTSVERVAPMEPAPGLANILWRRRVGLGDRFLVTGSVFDWPTGTVAVALEGPAGAHAETVLSAFEGEPLPFSLSVKPPGLGRFLYRLSVQGDNDQPAPTEWIDVQVVDAQLPTVLWLEDAPDFETKYVKQWIADQGGHLAIRSRVSRGRYHFEFHGLEELSLEQLSPEDLDRFDLVVAGQRVWERLTPAERTDLMHAVGETGLGVLVRLAPDVSSGRDPNWPLGFAATRIQDVDRLLVYPQGGSSEEISPVESPPFELRPEPSMSPLFTDRAGRVLAMTRPEGRGTVGVTLMRKTYPWVLEGDAEALHTYWRGVVEALTREDGEPVWHVSPGPILADEPLELVLNLGSPESSIPRARYGPIDGIQERVALRQDPLLATRWTAKVWPAVAGWFSLEGGGAQAEFYVAASKAWPRWQLERRLRSTQLAALEPRRVPGSGERAEIRRPIPRLPFFLIVLLGLGVLWLDERRGSH